MKTTFFLLLIVLLIGYSVKKSTKNMTTIKPPTDYPIVRNLQDVKDNSKSVVFVYGTYELQDVRMRQTPKKKFEGHAGVVLEDGYCVYLFPPSHKEAIRPIKEQKQCNYKKVYAKGKIYPFIPQSGTIIKAPCLMEIESIRQAE